MRNRYEFQGGHHVNNEDEEDYEVQEIKSRNSIYSLSVFYAFGVLVCVLGLYGIAYGLNEILPTPIKISEESLYPDSFVAERAQHDLKLLTDLGPRITGSYENEVLAVDILQREIGIIQQHANINQKIELDVQVTSGSYFLNFKPNGAINAYGKVQNVVARLASRNNSRHSVLVNAHFDSVPTSPGGSDDGINCAVMLEILRKLSRSATPPEHNIIFLFNGAEETPLKAAHGFITQHKWAKEVKVLVNLEAAGAGGKIILFQSGPGKPWLMKYYNKVPHPFGQAAGEELFQSNVIPSGTDFRIFRDFGGVIGLDMAFVKSGYRYHTKYDDFWNIPLGSFQHAGDNALSLVRNLANAPELSKLDEQPFGKVTFFDIFGWFMVSYNDTLAIILNLLGILISLVPIVQCFRDFELSFSKFTFKYIGLATTAIVLGWLISVGFVMLVGVLLDCVGYSMSWYRNPWIIFGLYCAPVVLCSCGGILVLNRFYSPNKLCINVRTQIQAHAVRLIWTVVLLIGSFLGIRSVYAILVPVVFHAVIFILIHLFKIQHSVRTWQILYLLGMVVPILIVMYQCVITLLFFIPITGRIGNNRNPEIIIGLGTVLFTVLVTCFYVPLITLVRKPIYFIIFLVVVFLISFIIVFTPLGFPYSGNPQSPAPQRFWIFHLSRTFHNESGDIYKADSGFFINNMDRNSPNSVKKYVPELENARSVADDCDVALFCGLPLGSPRAVSILRESTWIPAGTPVIHKPVNLVVESREYVSSTVVSYNVTATGPDHMLVYVSPKRDLKVINISLIINLPDVIPIIWNDRPVYLISYAYGIEATPLAFQFEVEVPSDWNANATVDIAVVGWYAHKQDLKTPSYQKFLDGFPDWADAQGWLAAFESWVI